VALCAQRRASDRRCGCAGHKYCHGVPHGDGRITFIDGSEFVGEFNNGTVRRFGHYLSVAGDTMRGHFDKYGQLHGPGILAGSVVGPRLCAGELRHGLLHGPGVSFARSGEKYA
jgi:hypothetical protein